jgi:hypothetical protein
MRAIASALTYANEVGGTLVIGWKFDAGALEAPFRDLFDVGALPANVQVVEMGYAPDFRWNNSTETNSPAAWAAFLEANKGSPLLQFKSWAAFYKTGTPEWLHALKSLKPLPELAATAAAIVRPEQQTTGVHIRRTDHKKATADSPTEAFFATMHRTPSLYYYIASDDESERLNAKREFPQQIVQAPRRMTLQRTSTHGMQDAMIDFLCLSRCDRVIGSAGSSFGEIAAAYGGIPFFTVHRE